MSWHLVHPWWSNQMWVSSHRGDAPCKVPALSWVICVSVSRLQPYPDVQPCPDVHPVWLCAGRVTAEGALSSPCQAAQSPPSSRRHRGVSTNSPRRSELANPAVQAFCGQACEGSYACELNHCANARPLRAVAVQFFGWEAGAGLWMRFPPRVVM